MILFKVSILEKNVLSVIVMFMVTILEIKKLAELSRLEIPESEMEGLTKEIGSILGYIDQILLLQIV